MSGWVPEFAQIPDAVSTTMLPKDLVADLPPSSFSTVTWDGKRYGAVFTLSLLTLFYNKEHLEQAGLQGPPKTWDELKGYAKELTRDGRYGWVLNYGDPAGIGGTASYWMVFLQQAGGKMYGDDGMPVFKTTPGVDALQLMVDLYMPLDRPRLDLLRRHQRRHQRPDRRQRLDDDELAVHVEAGQRSGNLQDRRQAAARRPPGRPGGDRLDRRHRRLDDHQDSASPGAGACKLIEFYLDPAVQKRQVLDTGWLPIRLSVLQDPEVQKGARTPPSCWSRRSTPMTASSPRTTTR